MDAEGDREIGGIRPFRPEDLIAIYAAGVFPMAERADDPTVFWIDPEMRGIIPIDPFHVPASLRKRLKKRPFRVTINRAFDDVIAGCAAHTPVRGETWINQPIRDWFRALHRMGWAHSVECWNVRTTPRRATSCICNPAMLSSRSSTSPAVGR